MDFIPIVNNLFEDDVGIALFHDAVYDAIEVSHPPEKLKEIFLTLPQNIQIIALQWGLSDTVFRNEAYSFIKVKRYGGN